VLAACFDERTRLGPPVLTLTLDRTTVASPGVVGGRVVAEDPDGIDSVWIVLDTDTAAADGLFRPVVDQRILLSVRPGHAVGSVLEVKTRGRDLDGFTTTLLDTVMVVAGSQ
jgi:hypothetical protein